MTELQIRCYKDLYNASIDSDGDPVNFTELYERYGDKIPYWKYYVSEYKLHRIVDEYADTLKTDMEKYIFKDSIYMGLAPSSSYMAWVRVCKDEKEKAQGV